MSRLEKFQEDVGSWTRWDRFIYRASCAHMSGIRAFFAARYLEGDGIEIGAQSNPLRVDATKARVRYVDNLHPDTNAARYYLDPSVMVKPDFFLEADDLSVFEEGSLDFVISSHLLEHIDDPIFALREWMRVLRPGGTLYLAVPNYRANEYDFLRKPMGLDHFTTVQSVRDPEFRMRHKVEHWKEFIEVVEEIPKDSERFSRELEAYIERDDRIHFHVYDSALLLSLLRSLTERSAEPVHLVDAFQFTTAFELIFILRKEPGTVSITTAMEARNHALILWKAKSMIADWGLGKIAGLLTSSGKTSPNQAA